MGTGLLGCIGLILGVFSAPSLSAQVRWKDVDSLFQPLPRPIHVFFTSDSLDGLPNRAYYVSVQLNDKSLDFVTDTTFRRRLTPLQYFERNSQPLIVVNSTFFTFAPHNRNLNIVMKDGRLLSQNIHAVFDKSDSLYHYVSRSAIGIDDQRRADVAWVFTDTVNKKVVQFSSPVVAKDKNAYPSVTQLKCNGCKVETWKVRTAVGGGPTLIANGRIEITNEQERLFTGARLADRHPRTAMGYTRDGRLIIMVIEGRNPGKAEGVTLLQEAKLLLETGCVEALNLDGGGSSCLLINGRETIRPSDKTGQRPVPAVFMVTRGSKKP